MVALRESQQVLLPSQIDRLILQDQQIGEAFQKKTYRISGIERSLGNTLIAREHRGFHSGNVKVCKGNPAHRLVPSFSAATALSCAPGAAGCARHLRYLLATARDCRRL